LGEIHSKDRIRDVATKLFKEKGFANVSIREICQVADVSLPMVYYYFTDKQGLFKAVTREQVTLKPFLDELQKICDEKQDSHGKIHEFIRFYLAEFPIEALNTGLYMRENTKFDGASLKRMAADLDKAQTLLSQLILVGVKEKCFRETDSQKAADCILGMMHRSISQQAHFQRSFDPIETSAYIFDFAQHALRSEIEAI
jgi:AcrR family transcriptional regulator